MRRVNPKIEWFVLQSFRGLREFFCSTASFETPPRLGFFSNSLLVDRDTTISSCFSSSSCFSVGMSFTSIPSTSAADSSNIFS